MKKGLHLRRRGRSRLDGADDQRCSVLPVVMVTGVEVWIQWFREAVVAVGVNVALCLCVVKTHWAFLIVQEHSHLLGGLLKAEGERRSGAGEEASSLPAADCPEAAVGTHSDEAPPVDGRAGHAQIPVGFIANLEPITQK